MTRQFLSFGVIGTLGFIVDASLLVLFNKLLGFDLFSSRLVSFSGAVTTTWYLNRKLTFTDRKDRHVMHEWLFYTILNGIGGLINFAIFMLLVFQNEFLADNPILPLAIASVIAMVFNFTVSKYLVFRTPRL